MPAAPAEEEAVVGILAMMRAAMRSIHPIPVLSVIAVVGVGCADLVHAQHRPRVREATVSPVALERALTGYQARLAPLVDRDDLIDSLYLGWFDRPYRRATLACVVKTMAVLERELALRRAGNGAMSDDRVRNLQRWLDGALARACEPPVRPGFIPDRVNVGLEVPGLRTVGTSLSGFADRATTTRHDEWLGDLDVLACCGSRVYAKPTRTIEAPEVQRAQRRRATALGMFKIDLAGPDDSVGESGGRPLRGVRLGELIRLSRGELSGHPPAETAAVDPPDGETWAESLARRGLYRGVTGSVGSLSYGWRVPVAGRRYSLAQLRAAMWVHACDGQVVGLLEGWRDLRDGSRLPYASLATAPALVEAVAHTALDILYHADFLAALDRDNSLAVVIDESAIDPEDTNRWSAEFAHIAEALLDRQIRFDVVPMGRAGDPQLFDRYALAIVAPPGERKFYVQGVQTEGGPGAVGDGETWTPARFGDWVDELLAERTGLSRIVALDENEGRARDVYVRSATNGRRVVLVNLSPRARRVSLVTAEGESVGGLTDVFGSEHAAVSGDAVDLGPWQVRLLVSPSVAAEAEKG